MDIRSRVNRALKKLGYALVREETLERLIESSGSRQPAEARAARGRAVSPGRQLASAWLSAGSVNRCLAPALNKPPHICTSLAPKFGEGCDCRFSNNIAEFQKNGITVLGTDADVAARWRETEIFDRDVGNVHSSWDWAGGPILPRSHQVRSGIPSENLVSSLSSLFTEVEFETFFRGILGCPITVANCRLVKSLPHGGEGVGPQSWHQDGCPPGVIRGVLYLTDVDEKTGPFQYKDATGRERTVLGKTGDLLVFDAMRLLHRAMPPERRERTAIDLVFMPRLPGQEFRVIVAGMNHWPVDPFFFSVPLDKSGYRQAAKLLDAGRANRGREPFHGAAHLAR